MGPTSLGGTGLWCLLFPMTQRREGAVLGVTSSRGWKCGTALVWGAGTSGDGA